MKGTRVYHEQYGKGTVTTTRDEWTTKKGDKSITGRLGVVFDHHTLTASPAFFWKTWWRDPEGSVREHEGEVCTNIYG